MLDSKDSRLTMTPNHKISFSIVDILDPKKFNSKRERELCVVKETYPALNGDGASLELDACEEGQHQVEHSKTGKYAFLTSFYSISNMYCFGKGYIVLFWILY